ncbi:MAG: T9SS type A sorting domain-containing protein [Candidatus Fermentibacter sp.]|nr:T9SS type A sorting domain-containing protein [Candidatus Fermentibacter sp.]
MAPLYLFYSGAPGTPYAQGFNTARFNLYSVGSTPTVKIDGLASSYTPSTYATTINNRLAVPSYVSIETNVVGDATGGTVYYAITAEQDLGVSGQIKVWSAIVENGFTAPGNWGGYSGMEMRWIPRSIPAGNQGTVISFTGPYPQTVNIAGTYLLDCNMWDFESLALVTLVQPTTGTREVLNAAYTDLPDTATGIEGPEGGTPCETAMLSAWPNPSHGELSIGAMLPSGVSGEVTVFDLSGRAVAGFEASGLTSVSIEEPGVYLARMETSSGEAVTTRFTVIR